MPNGRSFGNYRFLPWLRRGLSTEIGRSERDGSSGSRAAVSVSIRFNGEAGLISHARLDLYGAGEVAALDTRSIVRTWPAPDASDAESNGWPLVEFDQPDLPWRYTPAPAAGDRLRPWLALAVFRRDEIMAQRPAGPQRGLPTITVSATALPDLSQGWAWAHAAVSGATTTDAASLQRLLATDPHRAVSRLLSPRRLEPRSSYVACLVPALERGRLVGLGQNPDDHTEGTSQHVRVDDLAPAWGGGAALIEVPVYYQWSFQTGDGDFESLVRRLRPATLPPRFGTRPLDAGAPGAGLDGTLTTALGLEGAFAAPGQRPISLDPAQRDAWLARLRQLLDRPAGLQRSPSPEQAIAPPLYGRFHALQATLDPSGEPRWFQELNADPTLRAAAGIGAKIVQDQRQHLLASAWQQVEGVRRINEELRQAQLARESARRVKKQHFDGASSEAVLQMAAPVLARIQASPMTIQARLRRSPLTPGLLEAQWRKLTRPLGSVGLRIGPAARPLGRTLLRRTNQGDVSAAPPPPLPPQLATRARVFAPLAPPAPGTDRTGSALLIRLLVVLLVAAAAVVLVGGVIGWALAVTLFAAASLATAARVRARAASTRLGAAVRDGTLTGAQIRATPLAPEFTPREVARSGAPSPMGPGASPTPSVPGAQARTTAAAAFRTAAAEALDQLGQPPIAREPLVQVNLGELRGKVLAALDPTTTIEARLVRRLSIDPALARRARDALDPVLAAPDFPQPMYRPLRDLSQQWLLPGLSEVPPNSLTVLRANARFIEAYMVGLNHEMARVLLWSEYPTDQRGTCFRRFWDTAGRLPRDGDEGPAADIPPIHTWDRAAALGENIDAKAGNVPLLLLVRGDVLHRYPNTDVYVVRAQRGVGQRRVLGSEERHPLFRGSLSPDLSFFAFDLDLDSARGTGARGGEGWFFVLQEHPGEPRFGLDAGDPGLAPARSYGELSWGHLAADAAGLAGITYVDLNADLPDLRGVAGAGALAWHADRGLGSPGALASHLACIGLRRPARIAVHASEMLRGDSH